MTDNDSDHENNDDDDENNKEYDNGHWEDCIKKKISKLGLLSSPVVVCRERFQNVETETSLAQVIFCFNTSCAIIKYN
jgi:hypothetical protein